MISPIETRPINGGVQRLFTFENGYGASVVCHEFSYGREEGLWELAVTHGGPAYKDSHLCYATPIADDVIGWLDEDKVQATLRAIAELPYLNAAACPRRRDQ